MESANLTVNSSQGIAEKTTKFRQFKDWMSSVGQSLLQALVVNEEVQVYQRRDRTGQTYWVIQNLTTGQRVISASEDEARIWMETRHLH